MAPGRVRSTANLRRRRRRAGALASAAAIVLALGATARGGPGAEEAYIPAEDAEWEGRLERAEALLEQEHFADAIEILQRAVELGGGKLCQIERLEENAEAVDPAPKVDAGARRVREIMELLQQETRTREAMERKLALIEELRRLESVQRNARSSFGQRRPTPFRPRYYISVPERARRILASLPAEARTIYRRIHGDTARRLWERAVSEGDEVTLRKVALDYFPSAASVDARLTYGDRLFERGRVRRALALWSATLGAAVDDPADAARLRLRILAGLRQLGPAVAYSEWRARLVDSFERLAAGDAAAVERFRDDLKRLESRIPVSAAARSVCVPLAGEGALRPQVDRLPALASSSGPYRYAWNSSFWAEGGVYHPDRDGFGVRGVRDARVPIGRAHGRFEAFREHDLPCSFFPATTGSSVFVSAPFYLFQLDLESGRVERQIARPFLPLNALRYKERSRSSLYVPAVARGRVLSTAITRFKERREYMGYEINEEWPVRSVVTRRADDLKIAWHTRDFALGTDDDPLPVSAVTPPLVLEDRVVVGGWVRTGHVNAVLACHDLDTGRALWTTRLASNQVELTMFGDWAREPLSWVLLEDEGLIYCVTGIGALAAVDARSGEIAWLRTYQTVPISPSFGPTPTLRDLTWSANPPLLVDGVLYAAPRDSRFLHAIDVDYPLCGHSWRQAPPAASGPPASAGVPDETLVDSVASGRAPVIWKRRFVGSGIDLLGYVGGKIYYASPERIAAIDVSADDAGSTDLSGSIDWRSRASVRGRPALAEQGIVFCDTDGLRRVDYDLGEVVNLLERPFREYFDGEHPGNVVLWRDRILVQSRHLICAFEPPRETPPGNDPDGESPDQKF